MNTPALSSAGASSSSTEDRTNPEKDSISQELLQTALATDHAVIITISAAKYTQVPFVMFSSRCKRYITREDWVAAQDDHVRELVDREAHAVRGDGAQEDQRGSCDEPARDGGHCTAHHHHHRVAGHCKARGSHPQQRAAAHSSRLHQPTSWALLPNCSIFLLSRANVNTSLAEVVVGSFGLLMWLVGSLLFSAPPIEKLFGVSPCPRSHFLSMLALR
jgi:hypothetical protein